MGKSGRVEARTKSEKAKWELEGKFPPLFAFIFFSMVFLFFSSTWKEKDVKKKHLKQKGLKWEPKVKGRKRLKQKGLKREPKMKGQSESLKVISLLSLGFFFVGFLYVCLFCVWEEEDNGNVSLSSFVVLLQRRGNDSLLSSLSFLMVFKQKRQQQLIAVAFFLC